jgi:hypothetical protein
MLLNVSWSPIATLLSSVHWDSIGNLVLLPAANTVVLAAGNRTKSPIQSRFHLYKIHICQRSRHPLLYCSVDWKLLQEHICGLFHSLTGCQRSSKTILTRHSGFRVDKPADTKVGYFYIKIFVYKHVFTLEITVYNWRIVGVKISHSLTGIYGHIQLSNDCERDFIIS